MSGPGLNIENLKARADACIKEKAGLFPPDVVRDLIAALEAAQGENQELRRAAQDEAILKTRLNAVSAAKDAEIESWRTKFDAAIERGVYEHDRAEAAEAALKEAQDGLRVMLMAWDSDDMKAARREIGLGSEVNFPAMPGSIKSISDARALLSKQDSEKAEDWQAEIVRSDI